MDGGRSRWFAPAMTEAIAQFLAQPVVAVVGVSRTRGFGSSALAALRREGQRAYPVNEGADEIAGERCWRSLRDLPERPGAVMVVVPPARALGVIAECAALGIRHVWLQPGAESDAAVALARGHDIALVHGECVVMYAQPTGIHRLHRWIHDWRRRS
jgi:predicted CoA-binding protein